MTASMTIDMNHLQDLFGQNQTNSVVDGKNANASYLTDFQDTLDDKLDKITAIVDKDSRINNLKNVVEEEAPKIAEKVVDITKQLSKTIGNEISQMLNQDISSTMNIENVDQNLIDETKLLSGVVELDTRKDTDVIDSLQNNLFSSSMNNLTSKNDIQNNMLSLNFDKTNSINQSDFDSIQNDLDIAYNDLLENFEEVNIEQTDVTEEQISNVEIKNSDIDLNLDEDMLKELHIEEVISSETENSSEGGESNYQPQSPQEHVIKIELGTNSDKFNFELSSRIDSNNTKDNISHEVNPSKIIEQVTKHLEGINNTSKVNIVLNPEGLGKVAVHIAKTPEGMSAQFVVTNSETKDILSQDIDNLKQTLSAQGVNVDDVSVKLNNSQETDSKQDWTEQDGSRGGNKEHGHQNNKDEKHKNLFEQQIAQAQQNKDII